MSNYFVLPNTNFIQHDSLNKMNYLNIKLGKIWWSKVKKKTNLESYLALNAVFKQWIWEHI